MYEVSILIKHLQFTFSPFLHLSIPAYFSCLVFFFSSRIEDLLSSVGGNNYGPEQSNDGFGRDGIMVCECVFACIQLLA